MTRGSWLRKRTGLVPDFISFLNLTRRPKRPPCMYFIFGVAEGSEHSEFLCRCWGNAAPDSGSAQNSNYHNWWSAPVFFYGAVLTVVEGNGCSELVTNHLFSKANSNNRLVATLRNYRQFRDCAAEGSIYGHMYASRFLLCVSVKTVTTMVWYVRTSLKNSAKTILHSSCYTLLDGDGRHAGGRNLLSISSFCHSWIKTLWLDRQPISQSCLRLTHFEHMRKCKLILVLKWQNDTKPANNYKWGKTNRVWNRRVNLCLPLFLWSIHSTFRYTVHGFSSNPRLHIKTLVQAYRYCHDRKPKSWSKKARKLSLGAAHAARKLISQLENPSDRNKCIN